MNNKKLSPGLYVYFPGTKRPVRLIEGPNKKGEYALEHGIMLLWIAKEKLVLVEDKKLLKKLETRTSKKPRTIQSSDKILRLDLHGSTQIGAKDRLELAIDQAIKEGISKIEVVHGIGTGKVKEAVMDYLNQSKHVSSYKPDSLNPGCLFVYL